MEGQPKRIIRHAMIGDGIGPVSAEELLATPTVRWELWRRMITDAHQAKPRLDLASCLMCGGPVYIRTKALRAEKLPLFAHFAGADASCPWFTGETVRPDDARAAQYQGRQESEAHRQLCNLIAELASADPRSIAVRVDEYLPPTANGSGRYPDVLIQWAGLPAMAVELQLSRTFQTEISARCGHYDREAMPLVWVLYGVDLDAEDIPQSFRDVLSRHRMNAFLIDADAIAASKAQQTLVLSVRLARADGSFERPRQVRLDELIFPDRGLPYVEDRLTPTLLAPVTALRKSWFAALGARSPAEEGPYINMRQPAWNPAFEALYRATPALRAWVNSDPANKAQFAALVAVAFSVVTHARGAFKNFATAQDNATAMLNSRLSSVTIGPYAYLLRAILRLSTSRTLLEGSVGRHLSRAIAAHDGNLCLEHEPEWEAMAVLLPEIFDGRLRAELTSVGAMPDWTAEIEGDDDGAWLYAG
jgi:hypothetical protein